MPSNPRAAHVAVRFSRQPSQLRRRGIATALAAAALTSFGWTAATPAGAAPSAGNTYAVTASISLDPSGEAYGVATDARVGKAYATQLQTGRVAVINTKTNKVTKQIPVGDYAHGVAVDETRHLLYVTSILANTVSVIDTKKDAVVATIPLVASFPYRVAVDVTTNTVYVTNNDGDGPALTIIDGATRKVTATVPLADPLSDIAVDPATQTVYGTNFSTSNVTVIDAATNAVSGTIPVGAQPTSVAVDTRSHEIYVANAGSDSVSVIDGRTNTVSTHIPVGDAPQAVTIDARKDAVYVAHAASGVAVIDAAAKTLVVTASLRGGATDIAVNARTSAVYVAGGFDFGAGYVNGVAVITCSPVKGVRRCS